jgi:hypothetical protein
MRDELKEKIVELLYGSDALLGDSYVNALLDFIITYTEKECNKAKEIGSIERDIEWLGVWLEVGKFEIGSNGKATIKKSLKKQINKLNELKKGIKVV